MVDQALASHDSEHAITPAAVAAATAWAEARGEGLQGMQAVLNVIQTRAEHKFFGHDIVSVCQWPYQFSCWNHDSPERARMLALTLHDPSFALALPLAQKMIDGQLPDITGGADSYYAVTIPEPAFARTGRFTRQIGHHRFYIVRRG